MLKSAPLYSYVPVSNLARARRFYEDKLGLGPGEPVGPGLSFRCDGVAFEEYDMPGMKSVNSIFVGGGAKAAWFKDSEGNIMAPVQDDLGG